MAVRYVQTFSIERLIKLLQHLAAVRLNFFMQLVMAL